jgi:hypothetical protein
MRMRPYVGQYRIGPIGNTASARGANTVQYGLAQGLEAFYYERVLC